MPNIASILKEEIVRLARKEVRGEVEGLKKASAQHRSDLADLKRRVAVLEKQHSRLEKKASSKVALEAASEVTTRFRFSAKRLAAQRQKLGLSAAGMGTLLGVSAQTVYNWEAGKSRPRQQQLAAIAALRKTGKREAQAQLAKLAE
jgi:DNA-binding transcriptional regulator YiaG